MPDARSTCTSVLCEQEADRELNEVALSAAANPDAQADIAELFQRMWDPIQRYMETKVGNPATAEDLAQDTFIKVVENIGNYQGGGIWAWVFAIARNVCNDHYRPMRNRGYEQPAAEIWKLDVPSPELGPEEVAQWNELGRAMNLKINKLRPDQREVLRLRLRVGLTPAQTAEVMGKNVGTIRVLQYRALKSLRTLLPESSTLATYLLSASPVGTDEDVIPTSCVELRERNDVAGASG
ncbi:RNA polymerase sigma factor [Streptomyces sp. NPDC001691]|uniref:RNA polymerase sigma factor n=1 Tax=Streptomyces sp. NPDC001691 TaxID=3364600 RepID=UPI0036B68CEE